MISAFWNKFESSLNSYQLPISNTKNTKQLDQQLQFESGGLLKFCNSYFLLCGAFKSKIGPENEQMRLTEINSHLFNSLFAKIVTEKPTPNNPTYEKTLFLLGKLVDCFGIKRLIKGNCVVTITKNIDNRLQNLKKKPFKKISSDCQI